MARRRADATYAPARVPTSFSIPDSSFRTLSAERLLHVRTSRDVNAQLAKLAQQFVEANARAFHELGVTATTYFNGNRVYLQLASSTKIGAVPLMSPTSGKPDYGLLVRPRFEWSGLGTMLGEMGWRVVPTTLRLPLLPSSDREIPAWVLSTIVLGRIEAMLRQLERRFELVSEDRLAPRGAVNWSKYAIQRIGRSRFLDVPSVFPDLRDDGQLRGAIHFTLRRHLAALDGQRAAGAFVLGLIALCQKLLGQVSHVSPREPTPRELEAWLRGSLKTDDFRNGIEAIEWTAEDRGLAGLSDLRGLPWVMSMEDFFEAWCERVLLEVSRTVGGRLRTGRQMQTVTPLSWSPAFLGSQKSLRPDLILEREDLAVIVDAKYKEHWEELQTHRWLDVDEDIRERHRHDLLQVLAYANLASTPRTIVCLAYPCRRDTWQSLKERGHLFRCATLNAAERRIDLWLTAFPMGHRYLEVASELAAKIATDE